MATCLGDEYGILMGLRAVICRSFAIVYSCPGVFGRKLISNQDKPLAGERLLVRHESQLSGKRRLS
jgi:hypothetical protein